MLQPQSPALILAKARLLAEADKEALDDETIGPIRPWHLKLNVKLYDDAGKPSSTEVAEEWWADAQRYRIVYSGSYRATVIRTPDGLYRTKRTQAPPYPVARLLERLTHMGPSPGLLARSDLEVAPREFGNIRADCMTLRRAATRGAASVRMNPADVFSTMYCLAVQTNELLLTNELGTINSVPVQRGVFQQREVPTKLKLIRAGVPMADGAVETLATIPVVDFSMFTPSPKEKLMVRYVPGAPDPVLVPGDPIARRAAVMPAEAKEKGVGGQVMLHVAIGQDGFVHQICPVSSPDESLTRAAVAAVGSWSFKPAMVNGEKAEVETILTVTLF